MKKEIRIVVALLLVAVMLFGVMGVAFAKGKDDNGKVDNSNDDWDDDYEPGDRIAESDVIDVSEYVKNWWWLYGDGDDHDKENQQETQTGSETDGNQGKKDIGLKIRPNREEKQIKKGERITLTASFDGEAEDYTIQWYVSKDGTNYEMIPGATGVNYSFNIDKENVHYIWRVDVDPIESEAEEETEVETEKTKE